MQQKSAELPIIQEQPEEDQDEFENASREEDDDEMVRGASLFFMI